MGNETEQHSFRPIVGIDLGTTNSAIAYISKGKPHILETGTGKRLIPSVVLIDPNDNIIVGENASAALVAMPDRTKAAVKREMGEDDLIQISGKSYSPEEVSAFILKEMKGIVDNKLGEGEKEAVITVPAYFTDRQRKATKRAGELAGFVVERIVNEPTAAALAFGLERLTGNRHVLVYDLGGGTFDVSVVEMMDGIIEVKASSGNNRLGGEDFDWLLVDFLAEEMIKNHEIDPRDDVRALAVLKEEAEKIKIGLSTEEQMDIRIPVVMMKNNEPIGLYKTITRESFIALIEPLLQETMESVSEVLEAASVELDEVDDILLVGGSTRIPRIHDLLNDYFGIAPRNDINPDEAVALGAAVQAGLKSGALSDSGLIVTDVAPFSMGIAVIGESGQPGEYKAIITKNTTIPVTRKEKFYTAFDNQTIVDIDVYQGEQKLVKHNHFIHHFILDGLPEGPAGAEEVEVTFRYNLNGILEVTAKNVSSNKQVTVTIEDAIDRSSTEAFEESLKKIESASETKYGELELSDYEQQSIFNLLDEKETSVDDLLEEARQWKKRCLTELENTSDKEQNKLQQGIKELDKAIAQKNEVELEEAIDFVTDIFIELEI